MADSATSRSREPREPRVHNVYLHQRGKKSRPGTLTLTKHHLTLTYPIDEQRAETAPISASASSMSLGATTTEAIQKSTAEGTERSSGSGGEGSKPGQPRPKTRTKTLWLAYPMVSRCVLRPSHMPISNVRSPVHGDGSNDGVDGANDAFPPTFGSSTYGRPSTDSAHLAPYSTPRRAALPATDASNESFQVNSGRTPAIRIRCKDFQMMALHFHSGTSDDKSADEAARETFFMLRSRCCVDRVEDMLAFHFHPLQQETQASGPGYDAHREFARMGIGSKAAEGAGSAWRITDINYDYSFSATYPSVLCVPRVVSDNMLKYGGVFRSRSRIPALSYLHFNGGSISRSSQPLVGVQGKRNPQDERLVTAIFSSHTPPLTSPEDSPPQLPSLTSPSTTTLGSNTSDPATVDSDVPAHTLSRDDVAAGERTVLKRKVYGSTRRNLIVDARPKINALANRATGGGIEDISNYQGTGDVPVEKVFLNIQNIHVMRASLEKVIDSFANSDYVNLAPDQEILRKSGWLGHIAGVLEGSELVARAVGLSGSHVVVHCSDGWDRTSQVSALAQIMLDPHYRTLDGFITLVQKDFLAFGHKFRDRDGIMGSEKWFEVENERIMPSRSRETTGSDPSSLNVLGSKALSGAKSWFDKSRGSLFRQQNVSHDSLTDATSRPASPPPNPLIHSPPSTNGKEEKEHRTSEKEIAPIFHQFLEAVWQLRRQHPRAFEFNDRFLLRLLYQTYAGLYGEFLFNSEKERWQHRGKTPSVWGHFLARRAEFIDPEYTASKHDALLLPKRGADQQIEVRWWTKLFGREDDEMNLPRALARVDPPSLNVLPSSASFDEGASSGAEKDTRESALKQARSTPNLTRRKDDHSAAGLIAQPDALTPVAEKAAATDPANANALPSRPPITHQETDFEILAKYTGLPAPTAENGHAGSTETKSEPVPEGEGLSTTSTAVGREKEVNRLDFAAFASQNAFRD